MEALDQHLDTIPINKTSFCAQVYIRYGNTISNSRRFNFNLHKHDPLSSVPDSFGVPIMKIAADDTFKYESPYWENDELLNENSAWEDGKVNSKYQTFLDVKFNTIKVCLKDAYEHCYTDDGK